MPSKVIQILNDQRRSGEFCDVIIKLVSGAREWAHYCVLAAQSNFVGNQYFRQSDLQFSMHHPITITVNDFDCGECLKRAIDYMYSDDDVFWMASEMNCRDDHHGPHMQRLGRLLSIEPFVDPAVMLEDKRKLETVNVESVGKLVDDVKPKTRTYQYRIQSEPSLSKMHKCMGCAFKCYKPSEMLFHMQVCQTNNTKCNLCDKRFETLTEFKDHLVRHVHLKPFFCVDCDQRFTTKTALNLHTPKHSLDAPHPCPNCSKRFKWKHGLNNHMIVHANEKRLLCDECGYSTSHLKTLRAHQLSHTGIAFRCPSNGCSYTSRRKENLNIHIATHSNATPFVCEVCGHRFSQNKNLKRHALLHVSKNLIKCPHCEFTSYRTDKIKEHMVRQHTEKPLKLELDECVPSALDKDVSEVASVNRPKRLNQRPLPAKRKPAFILPKKDILTTTVHTTALTVDDEILSVASKTTKKSTLNRRKTKKATIEVRSTHNTRPIFILPKDVNTTTTCEYVGVKVDIDSAIILKH